MRHDIHLSTFARKLFAPVRSSATPLSRKSQLRGAGTGGGHPHQDLHGRLTGATAAPERHSLVRSETHQGSSERGRLGPLQNDRSILNVAVARVHRGIEASPTAHGRRGRSREVVLHGASLFLPCLLLVPPLQLRNPNDWHHGSCWKATDGTT